MKSCVLPAETVADDGAMEFAAGQDTVMLADADFAGSATLAAITVTALLGGTGGAVYVTVSGPVALNAPLAPPPPLTLLRLQLTAEFAPPLTVAVKFCVRPGGKFAAFGVMLTEIALSICTLADALA